MREPWTELYLHAVWGTWDRLPLITPELRPSVYAALQAKCTELRTEVIAMGGIEDHVHLLVRFPPTLAVSDLLRHTKGSSSHLATHRLEAPVGFKWQGAYGAFTVSKADVPRVRDYILRQEEHHRNGTLLKQFEIPTDQ